jgi:hypothetical protein
LSHHLEQGKDDGVTEIYSDKNEDDDEKEHFIDLRAGPWRTMMDLAVASRGAAGVGQGGG